MNNTDYYEDFEVKNKDQVTQVNWNVRLGCFEWISYNDKTKEKRWNYFIGVTPTITKDLIRKKILTNTYGQIPNSFFTGEEVFIIAKAKSKG